MPALKSLFQRVLRYKRAPVLKPSARREPASQANLSSGQPSFSWRYIAAHLVGTIALDCLVEYAQPGRTIPELIEAGKRNIREKAAERIERLDRSTPKIVRAGLRNIEDNAEKRIANFEKLCRALRIPRFPPASS